MGQRRAVRITTRSGEYSAVPTAALVAGESALRPEAAWQIIARLLTSPVELGDLHALARAMGTMDGKPAAGIDSRRLKAAFLSGAWSLIVPPRMDAAPVFREEEPVAEQIRTAKVVKTWVEMEVVDEQGRPVANQAYLCMLPDGTFRQGETDGRGRVRFDGIDPGNCAFSLTDLSPERWRRG